MAKSLGKYRLLERIDRAGGAEIYLARQTTVDRLVTLTIFPRHHAGRAAFKRRFERQIAAACKLAHPNVVRAIDAGTFDGHQYIAAEYAGGRRLSEALDAQEWFPIRRCIGIGLDIARALAHLSEHRIVHRSVSPRTIVLAESGVAKLRGFSLSKVMEGDASETWFDFDVCEARYTSPESARGVERVDARADLYSLGCVLHHLVTGRPPFSGLQSREVLASQVHDLPPDMRTSRSDLPEEFRLVIAKCLRKDRDLRYQTAAELVADLEALQQTAKPADEPRGTKPAPLRWLAGLFRDRG